MSYRPPGWATHDRPGAVEAAGGRPLVVEGVRRGRAELAGLADLVVWVQSDRTLARIRGLARDASYGTRTPAEAEAFWDDWMTEEEPFLAADRPWERADLVVLGTPPDGYLGGSGGAVRVVLGLPLLAHVGWVRREDAELVALRVGHHLPGDLVALADVSAGRAQALESERPPRTGPRGARSRWRRFCPCLGSVTRMNSRSGDHAVLAADRGCGSTTDSWSSSTEMVQPRASAQNARQPSRARGSAR